MTAVSVLGMGQRWKTAAEVTTLRMSAAALTGMVSHIFIRYKQKEC